MAVFLQVLKLFGGLGIFLFGMTTMSSNLERFAGNKLQSIMQKVTGNLFKSVLLGAAVAALTQSSSATTVMVVGFVNAGLLSLEQSVGIIMGANIGTTVTAWLLSLNDIPGGVWYLDLIKPTTLAPIALIAGAVLMFFCKNKKKKIIGEFLIGLGLLFIGMDYMSGSMAVVFEQVPALQNLFAYASNPLFGLALGAIVTAVIQSSAASVGMLQAIAATGTLTFHAAFPIIMGQNIGTCVTALLSGVGTNKNAKRTSMIHLYFNVIGTAVFLLIFYAVQYFIGLPFWESIVSATDISTFHSFFNIATTLMLLPFSRFLVWLVKKTVKDESDGKPDPFALLDKRFHATPPIAIANAKTVMLNMLHLAQENLSLCRRLSESYDAATAEAFLQNEEMLDLYEIKLTQGLTDLTELSLNREDNLRVSAYLRMVTNIERIGDYCDNIREILLHKRENDVAFSDSATESLRILFDALNDILSLTAKAFADCEMERAIRIEILEEVIDGLQETLETGHMTRLRNKECNAEAGVLFLEILTNAERIADHCSNIGVAVLQTREENHITDRHAYLRDFHARMQTDYKDDYETLKGQYQLPEL